MVVDFKSILDAAFSDDVELIIGELGRGSKVSHKSSHKLPLKEPVTAA